MADLLGTLHFLALIGLTGAAIEARIESLPQWTTPLILVGFLAVIILYAAMVGAVYT